MENSQQGEKKKEVRKWFKNQRIGKSGKEYLMDLLRVEKKVTESRKKGKERDEKGQMRIGEIIKVVITINYYGKKNRKKRNLPLE